MSRLEDKRKEIEAEIADIRRQITKARELGQQIDDLCVKLAILRSDLMMCQVPGCLMPPAWNRTHNIFCKN